jgi:hypothetical protein
MEQDILSARRNYLTKIIQDSLGDSESHSRAFAIRLLGKEYASEINLVPDADTIGNETVYGGYPPIASLGFLLGAGSTPSIDKKELFLDGVNRLSNRSEDGLKSLLVDDIAILGIADGLTQIKDDLLIQEVQAAKQWLVEVANTSTSTKLWSSRMRDLAGDLLDARGRLRILPESSDINARALEIVLHDVWQEQFIQTPMLSTEYGKLLKELLKASPPSADDLERAVIWLRAIDLSLDPAIEEILSQKGPPEEVVSILETIKGNLDRKAQQSVRRNLWMCIGMSVVALGALAVLIHYLDWDLIDPWMSVIPIGLPWLGGLIYFAFTGKEASLPTIYEHIISLKRHRLYQELGLDLKMYERLMKQVGQEIH